MSTTLHNTLCELLGCRYPVLQAGMGGVARASLAAAVSDAGAYGCLGMVREPPSLILREIAAVRELTRHASHGRLCHHLATTIAGQSLA